MNRNGDTGGHFRHGREGGGGGHEGGGRKRVGGREGGREGGLEANDTFQQKNQEKKRFFF